MTVEGRPRNRPGKLVDGAIVPAAPRGQRVLVRAASVPEPLRDSSVPRARLLWAAALLVEVIADDARGDQDVSALGLARDLGLAEPDRGLLPALTGVALGLFQHRPGDGSTEAALVSEVTGLFGGVKRPAPRSAEPAWPGGALTKSETRVLRYLPTHLNAPEIAAELSISANTVRTHMRHVYQKLGAHNRHEAVQRARAAGLLTGSSRRP
jgi:LuxR family transcriptional regulator, maltose regulon positive regulatory protein